MNRLLSMLQASFGYLMVASAFCVRAHASDVVRTVDTAGIDAGTIGCVLFVVTGGYLLAVGKLRRR